ncbi:MAG: hypothetical protein IKA48_04735 [Fibrobacter sp.]|nr:hypothetical protein [Fibrobacter sp.]
MLGGSGSVAGNRDPDGEGNIALLFDRFQFFRRLDENVRRKLQARNGLLALIPAQMAEAGAQTFLARGGMFFHLPDVFVRKIFHSVVAAGKDAVHVVFIVGGGFVPQDMMICVVLGRIQVFRFGFFIEDTGR